MTHRFAIPSAEVLQAREKLVLNHFHDEVRQDWDDVLATFPHPHYEIIPTLTVHDGDADVLRPLGRVHTGLAQYPVADRHDQAGFFRQRNEVDRGDHAAQ